MNSLLSKPLSRCSLLRGSAVTNFRKGMIKLSQSLTGLLLNDKKQGLPLLHQRTKLMNDEKHELYKSSTVIQAVIRY